MQRDHQFTRTEPIDPWHRTPFCDRHQSNWSTIRTSDRTLPETTMEATLWA